MESSVILLLGQLLLVLGLLLLADRWLHRHLQGIMYLLTQDQEIALWLYAIILLPGVALHELSHAATAALLRVRIGQISILPRRSGNRIQLGFVPVQQTDFFRSSLIGAAPFFIGSLAIFLLGRAIFGTPEIIAALTAGDFGAALRGLRAALDAPDVWLWAYLLFTVSNTMLPSRSDTHAWPLLFSALIVGAGIVTLAGGGAAILQGLSAALATAVRWLVLLGGSTLLIDLPFFLFLFLLEKTLERLRGMRLEYG